MLIAKARTMARWDFIAPCCGRCCCARTRKRCMAWRSAPPKWPARRSDCVWPSPRGRHRRASGSRSRSPASDSPRRSGPRPVSTRARAPFPFSPRSVSGMSRSARSVDPPVGACERRARTAWRSRARVRRFGADRAPAPGVAPTRSVPRRLQFARRPRFEQRLNSARSSSVICVALFSGISRARRC